MSLEFNYYKINDIGEVVSGGTPSTSKNEYWYGDISWITPKDLSSYGDIYISRGERNISQEGLDNSSARLVPKNTVLMTSRAPIGYIAIADNDLSTNQGFKSLICNEEICHYKYFYYWLKLNIKYIINNSNGSTFKEISGGTFKNLEISLPALNEQKKISSILWNIDEKISVLKKINKNLEELSSALAIHIFKNNDNETIELKEICKFIKGRKPKDISEFKENNFINYLTIDVLTNQNNSYAFDEKGIKANEYDILMVMDGASSGKLFYGKKGLVGSTLAKLETDSEFQEIVYQFLKINETFICENTTGTAIPHTDKGLVLNLQCPMSVEILEFSKTFKTIRSTIISNTNEINELQKLRDTLLPKLMSGEIDVSKINCYLRIKIMMKYLATFLIRKFLFILLLISIFLSILSRILTKKFCCSLGGNINSMFPYIFALIFGRVLPVHIELTHPLYSSDKT